ncbi:MAG: deoxyribose-phosphate aldolase [Candidatus Solibacter usitatus]|nr:deoxyribose-phosphate aldolase [Candidatus Solibacter usitatus]
MLGVRPFSPQPGGRSVADVAHLTQPELDQLVAQIGEEFLARLSRPALSKAEGLNLPEVCPGCVQRCAQTCAKKTREIVAQGADRVSASERLTKIDPAIAAMIDHTLLKPEATRADIVKLCKEARQYGFASVCVNPYWAALVAKELAGSPVKVCTVIGFPLGATSTESKVAETDAAVRVGAQEIDMVINVGALRSGDHEAVKQDIHGVAVAAHRAGAILKVILETALLDDNQKAVACTLAKMAGADFVKTSTGFSTHGATAHDVALMRQVVGPDLGVKASGGIRTLEDLRQMAAAGASRIGASASVKIVEATAR